MRLLRKILFPISLVYALVVHIRNYLYDVGVFKSKGFVTPTICIGNLNVGGTGKTPMAECLISLLRDDYRVALLSRGYRRDSSGFLLADEQSTVEDIGDEPFQIHSKFPGISVAVDADRQKGISILEHKSAPDVILLDDAFQHRKVKYGLSILLTAYGNLFVDDWYLPTGNLRDSKREAKRADVIIVTKCPPAMDASERQRIARKLKPEPHQQLLFSYLEYAKDLKGSSSGRSQDPARDPERGLAEVADKKITLVTGIADPDPLVAHLEKAGLTFEHLRFKDHHAFTEKEVRHLRQREFLLTTEKDFMRLKGKMENLYYLPIRHRFLGDGRNVLVDRLENFMNRNSLNRNS
ncbi:MAG TPA: tetraacyldisaccharide 4'-kinase [Pricia sp.]|nr:tetraacyldisaccharide 4'-kinase [Pricia sp.]